MNQPGPDRLNEYAPPRRRIQPLPEEGALRMHPYLVEQQIKARNENLRRELSRSRPEPAGRWAGPGPSLRHHLGWLLVGLGLRLAVGRSGALSAVAGRPGGGRVTHVRGQYT